MLLPSNIYAFTVQYHSFYNSPPQPLMDRSHPLGDEWLSTGYFRLKLAVRN